MAAGLPGIKDKLSLLHGPARHLLIHDDLIGLDRLSVESDESWLRGDRDFIRHGRHPSPSLSLSPSQGIVQSTYPEERPDTQPRSLGMLGLRR